MRLRSSTGNWLRTAGRLLALAALALGTAACEEDPSGPGTPREVVLGGLFSLTGNWSTLGQTSQAAMELAVEDVNQYLAGDAATLRFVAAIEDTKLDPELALEKAQTIRAVPAWICRGIGG